MNELVVSDLPWEEYDLEDNFKKLKMLIFGPSGIGKSVLAGSICEVAGPTLALDLDKGMTSLAAFGYNDKNKIRFLPVDGFEETGKPFTRARDYLAANNKVFKSTVIDSITSLQDKFILELCRKMNKPNPEQHMWNTIQSRMKEEVEYIKGLEVHVVLTALEKPVTDKNGNTTMHPSLKGATKEILPSQMDIIGYYSMQECDDGVVRRVIQFAQTDKFVAKDRTSSLPPYMIEPTMQQIFDCIRQKHDLQ